MKRRNFIRTIIGGVGGLAALPIIEQQASVEPIATKPASNGGTWYLTHKESRSGLRCTDVRIAIDSSEGEETLMRVIRRNPEQVRRILNG